MLLLPKRRSLLRVAIVIAAIGWANAVNMQHCKKALRDTTIELCSGGFRTKRSYPDDDLDPAADFASVIEKSQPRKRQIMSIREIIVSSRVPMPDTSYRAVPPSLWSRQRNAAPPALDEADAPPSQRRLEPLPEESGSHVGFDISYNEMIELYNEIYGRSGRSASESFMTAVKECCKDLELCLAKKAINLPCSWH